MKNFEKIHRSKYDDDTYFSICKIALPPKHAKICLLPDFAFRIFSFAWFYCSAERWLVDFISQNIKMSFEEKKEREKKGKEKEKEEKFLHTDGRAHQ